MVLFDPAFSFSVTTPLIQHDTYLRKNTVFENVKGRDYATSIRCMSAMVVASDAMMWR
jgi:hypothetical protein